MFAIHLRIFMHYYERDPECAGEHLALSRELTDREEVKEIFSFDELNELKGNIQHFAEKLSSKTNINSIRAPKRSTEQDVETQIESAKNSLEKGNYDAAWTLYQKAWRKGIAADEIAEEAIDALLQLNAEKKIHAVALKQCMGLLDAVDDEALANSLKQKVDSHQSAMDAAQAKAKIPKWQFWRKR